MNWRTVLVIDTSNSLDHCEEDGPIFSPFSITWGAFPFLLLSCHLFIIYYLISSNLILSMLSDGKLCGLSGRELRILSGSGQKCLFPSPLNCFPHLLSIKMVLISYLLIMKMVIHFSSSFCS